MENIKTGIACLVLYLVSFLPVHAQEVLVPAGRPGIQSPKARKSTGVDVLPDTLDLPFFDDFSRRDWLPNPTFWTDDYAYVNNTYTSNPVTIGVATLDAINSKGELNGSTQLPFESDFLTSVPINLDYPGRNDIWLSFFYEPKGLGDAPEPWDSLTVDFYAPDSNRWETVWSVEGSEKDTFRQVFIPVTAERFLKKGFRFRFLNYASLPRVVGYDDKNNNVDIWNVDYVYLDTARSSNVTALNDVSMISSLGSLLKTYQTIPWRHFPKAYITELKSTVDISYRNNDTTVRNVTRILKITDLKYRESDSVNGGATNVAPGVLKTFQFPYNYPFIFYEADSTVFEIRSYLVTEDLDYKWNDTVVRYQRFYNYYAYDDGSAENGYGLRGEGTANAAVAYRFKTYKTDTLRGVQMYFNRTLGDYTQDYFYLAVWDHDKDLNAPGELIYKMSGIKPEYTSELNQFFTYKFDTTIVVSELFYVGWIKTTERMLNVGWDVWNNNRDKIFYNLGQEWINTGFNGSLMLRPLMGKELSWPVSAPEIPEMRMQVYPNPASEYFYTEFPTGAGNASSWNPGTKSIAGVDGTAPGEWTIGLYNLQGKLVYESRPGETRHYVGDLPVGLYLVRVNQKGIYRAGSKLMIVR
jgi:hypothetical protein